MIWIWYLKLTCLRQFSNGCCNHTKTKHLSLGNNCLNLKRLSIWFHSHHCWFNILLTWLQASRKAQKVNHPIKGWDERWHIMLQGTEDKNFELDLSNVHRLFFWSRGVLLLQPKYLLHPHLLYIVLSSCKLTT